jgi:hypothetical protein
MCTEVGFIDFYCALQRRLQFAGLSNTNWNKWGQRRFSKNFPIN